MRSGRGQDVVDDRVADVAVEVAQLGLQPLFQGRHEINVLAAEIPFWSMERFTELELALRNRFAEILSR